MSNPQPADSPLRMILVIMGVVVGLTFLFEFGNVLDLALRLGVPRWIAPLVAPALDLTVLGLLLATRHLALCGVSGQQMKPARRLLLFASTVTLALNVTEPLLLGHVGWALFDAVGPMLLIGWAEVGPGLLQAVNTVQAQPDGVDATIRYEPLTRTEVVNHASAGQAEELLKRSDDKLLSRARVEDAHHWQTYRRPISADTLRRRLRISAAQV
jgi:hypothetical protein